GSGGTEKHGSLDLYERSHAAHIRYTARVRRTAGKRGHGNRIPRNPCPRAGAFDRGGAGPLRMPRWFVGALMLLALYPIARARAQTNAETSPGSETVKPMGTMGGSVTVTPEPCRLPAALPLALQVKDPVWSVLVGLSESNVCGVLTRARIEQEIK